MDKQPVYGWINARFRMDKLHYKSKFYERPLGGVGCQDICNKIFSPKIVGKLIGKLIGKLDGKFVGKFVGNVGWKIGWKCWVEMLVGKLVGKIVGKICWKCWLEMLGGNVGWKFGWKNCWKMLVENLAGKMCWKCWLKIWLEKMLVNGCEIIGEKIVATNLPLRLVTTNTIQTRNVSPENFVKTRQSWKAYFSSLGLAEHRGKNWGNLAGFGMVLGGQCFLLPSYDKIHRVL